MNNEVGPVSEMKAPHSEEEASPGSIRVIVIVDVLNHLLVINHELAELTAVRNKLRYSRC